MSEIPSKKLVEEIPGPKRDEARTDKFIDDILPDAATEAAVRIRSSITETAFRLLSTMEIVTNGAVIDKAKKIEEARQTKTTGKLEIDNEASMSFEKGNPEKMDFANGAEVCFEYNNPEAPDQVTDLVYKDVKEPSLSMHLSRLSGVQTRESNGGIQQISDPKHNFLWQRQSNGDWKVSPLNSRDRFSPPIHVMRGKAERTPEGGYSFDDQDGMKYIFKPNDSQSTVKHGMHRGELSDTFVTYKDGVEQEMRFKSGLTVSITHDNKKMPNEITSIEFKELNKASIKLQRVPGVENHFTDGKNTYAVNYETNDGALIIRDTKQGLVSSYNIDGIVTTYDTKTGIQTREKDDQPYLVEDPKSNCSWQKLNTGEWEAKALDSSKPFARPYEKITGQFKKLDEGAYEFKSPDGISHRFKADGSHDAPGDMNDLREKVSKNATLSKDQKDRLLNDYLPKFASRNFAGKSSTESTRERNETIACLSTLLEKLHHPAGYSDQERANILEQTAFHLAYETNFGQHLNTCNVTSLGVDFLHESPSQLARVMSELGNTGKFITADRSTIVPERQDIQEALSAQPFPPDVNDPRATGVSRAFAIAAANIYWQRRELNPQGQQVMKGSLKYEQIGGEGVYWHNDGQRFSVNDEGGNKIDNPYLSSYAILDIAEQITGRGWKNKFIEGKDYYDTMEASNSQALAFDKHQRVMSINSPVELHNALLLSKIQIAVVHTNKPPFYYDSGYGDAPGAGGTGGGWHSVAKVNYEPVFDSNNQLDPTKSMVYVDNTWNPARSDHLDRTRVISLATFYSALFETQDR